MSSKASRGRRERANAAKRQAGLLAKNIEKQQKERLRVVEATRSEMQTLLGSREQALGEGTFGDSADPRIAPFLQRSQWDEELGGASGISFGGLGITSSRDPDLPQWRKDRSARLKQENADYAVARKSFIEANPGNKAALKEWESKNKPVVQEEAREYLNHILSQIETLESNAQAAAQTGDFTTAQSLISQTAAIKARFSSNAQTAFSSYDDPALKARLNLMSPTARGTGRLLWTAKQLQDTGSEEYKTIQSNITRDPLEALRLRSINNIRNVVAKSRGTGRSLLETDMASGAARFANRGLALKGLSSLETAGQISSLQDELGTQESELLGRASKWLQTFSAGLAGSAATLGQNLLNNTPGVNEDYLNILGQYGLVETNLLGSASNNFQG